MGLHDRPRGCLLPSADLLVFPKISSLQARRSNVCVSVPAFRSVSGSMGIHQNNKTYKGVPSQVKVQNKLIFGRLLSPSKDSLAVTKNDGHSLGSVQETRPFSKSQEIKTCTFTKSGVSRGNLSPKDTTTFASRGKSGSDLKLMSGSSAPAPLFQETIRKPPRSLKFCSASSSVRASKSSGSHLMDEHTYIHSLSRSESLPDKGFQEGSFSMAGSRFPKIASCYGASSSFITTDDRRVRERLGRRYPSSQSMGCLVRRGSQSLHKLERTESSLPFSKGFSSLSEREISLDSVRQPDSNCLHHERRNSEISLLVGNDANSSGVRIVKLNSVSTQTSSREVEYPSRYGFQKRTHGDRMVAGQENLQLVVRKEWPSPSRPVCKQTEQTGKVLHFPLSRQSGNRDKCLVSGLESVGQHLLVPSGESLSKSDDLSIFIPRQGDFDSSRFSSSALVPSTSGEIQGAVQSARVPLFVSRDVQREGISSKPFNLSASRMETIEKALLEKNFSLGSASFINNSWKESTIRQYESIWKKFMAFLSARKIPHITIDPAIVCSFLEFNCKVLGRQYRTLATYKSSLSYPLKVARKLDLNDEDLVRFMRGVFLFRPPVKAKEMPSWSLNDLLCYLESEVFEPLESCSEVKLLQKTLFLILLASGRRIGETAQISRESVLFSKRGFPQILTLKWVEDFTPKRFAPEFQSPCPSIQPLVSSVIDHEKLCPVRAYDTYVNRSSLWLRKFPLKDHPKVLWSSPKTGRALDTKVLTGVFKTLVEDSRKSYKRRGKVNIGPHQARKFAASYASQVGQDEDLVRKVMGFSDLDILRKNYVAPVPFLKMHCVLPGGTFIPESNKY